MDALYLAKKLISFESVTPNDGGVLEFISNALTEIGFEEVLVKEFSDINKKAKNTLNLYAQVFRTSSKSDDLGEVLRGENGRNLCFAGHVDVVPPGKEYLWRFSPFEPTVEDGILYGRGASDMKAAIACFIAATNLFLKENKGWNNGNISILLTADEEGDAINGTSKMLKYISSLGYKMDDVIVGEPTSEKTLADTIKIGRRGSISFNLEIIGVEGHIAYPHLAQNPITELAKVIVLLKGLKLDDGTEFFQSSNLEVVKIGPEENASNVIPGSATCFFNIRYNNLHKGEDLAKQIRDLIGGGCSMKFRLSYDISGESFLSEKTELADIAFKCARKIKGFDPNFSTSGGTSDARFIKDYTNVIELGMLNNTAHKIDECVKLADIEELTEIYKKIIETYFKKQ